MSHEEAFLQTICDNPDDDSPRLIFADWLDEHGQGDRAEFIRLQCERARLCEWNPRGWEIARREELLVSKHRTEWLKPFRGLTAAPRSPNQLEFVRGFVGTIWVKAMPFIRRAEELFRTHPVQDVTLRDGDGALSLLAGRPFLDRLTNLCVRDDSCDRNTLDRFLKSSSFARLRRVSIDGSNIRPDRAKLLVAAHFLDRLESLRWQLDAELVGLLTAGRAPRALKELSVDNCAGTLDNLRALVACPALRNLTAFHVSFTYIGEGVGEIIAASPHLKNLIHLSLSESDIGDRDLAAVAASPHMGHLEVLWLDGNDIGAGGICALAASPYMSRLKKLIAYGLPIGDEGAVALANSPYLAELRELVIFDCGITDAGAKAIARSPHLTNLVCLNLIGNSIGDEGALALAESARLAAGLAHLGLWENPISPKKARKLRQVFGDRVRLTQRLKRVAGFRPSATRR